MSGVEPLGIVLLILGAITAFVLLVVFVMVPLFRGIGWIVTGFFRAIAWMAFHLSEFVGGIVGDTVRVTGALLAMLALAPLSLLSVIVGRWSAAAHYADSVKREFVVAGACLYRIFVRRPLKLLWLHGLLEGLEQRVPEAMNAAPGSDKPSRHAGQFEGYTIVGSLAGGGSGGKLYIARPDDAKRVKLAGHPEHVVIKSFTLSEGSSLPQIVRESRALECAKQLGHVLDHGMDEHRFHYVMPYHPGDHLGIVTRQLHGEGDGGLARPQLAKAMSYVKDLLATLSLYHEGGLWHKDVKPENIIVHDGRAHLVDLGLVTPLKSAMTLTTHGTEYFRDPEMVRQALRGVKVHQVDGAKFDIYAAGAVLYFMIENTFPAHGGLSRFTRKSPEALRWIVRRAMAEYQQRYTSAAMMLADLEAVATSADPFAFKPGELPSMRGQNAEQADLDVQTESPHAAQVDAAGSSQSGDDDRAWGLGVGLGAGGVFAKAGSFDRDKFGNTGRKARRPLLRVTNWWTGAYVVDDDGQGGEPHRGTSAIPPLKAKRSPSGRSAREQLQNARARARDLQRRAQTRRHKAGVERQPSAMLGCLVFAVLVPIIVAAVLMMARSEHSVAAIADSPAKPVVEASHTSATDSGRPLLLVHEHEAPLTSSDRNVIARVVERYENRGYNVIDNPIASQDELVELIAQWRDNSTGAQHSELEDILAEHDLYGFLHIKTRTTDADAAPRISETLIRSGRAGAENRRRAATTHAAQDSVVPDKPFILINDHPAKADSRVRSQVAASVDRYRERGWTVLVDDDAEVAIRNSMPLSVSSQADMTSRLLRELHERELGGVLYVHAGHGEGEPHTRVQFLELPAKPINPE